MNKKGQTLITLLVFMIVALTVATTSVSIVITNAQKSAAQVKSIGAYYAAEAGIENASISLLRNPSYAGGVIDLQPGETATVTVSRNGNEITVTSTGTADAYTRTIRTIFDYTNSILTVTSWQEIYP